MEYVWILLIGLAGGAICAYVLLEQLHREARRLKRQADIQEAENTRVATELADARQRLQAQTADFQAKKISYDELEAGNRIIQRDLRNLAIAYRKLEVDTTTLRDRQEVINNRVRELASRYLKDNVRWISATLGPNNFAVCRQRLQDVVSRCRAIGFEISDEEEVGLLSKLQEEFEIAVRAAFEREEQARIRARIREEQRIERERSREVEQAEAERRAIEQALARALRDTHDQHAAEIDELRSRLAEAEARSERALSQAQLTKAGYVYVISNIGSFGTQVFKIGMTRRLEPLDRVKELGDASVPFPFDIHMLISCDDAPRLENALHKALHHSRVNRVNPRKEFFRTDFQTIRRIVEQHHGTVEYTADPVALEYNQSLTMTDADQDFIEAVYFDSSAEDDEESSADEE